MTESLRQLDATDHSRDSAGLRYVYPVVSRRAGGVSIGINLNPNNACNWRCIYCQVPNLTRGSAPVIDLGLLETELRDMVGNVLRGDFLAQRVAEDSRRVADFAISGNGEPTSAKELADAIERIWDVKRHFGLGAETPLRLITNGSLVGRAYVQRALPVLDRCGGEVWFKVDAGTADGMARINGVTLKPQQVIRNLRRCAELCPTWVQTCVFLLDGAGPTDAEISAYLDLLEAVGIPSILGVLLYGIARPSLQPEARRLARLSPASIETVAEKIKAKGLTVRVSP